jgi:hypothetical protein
VRSCVGAPRSNDSSQREIVVIGSSFSAATACSAAPSRRNPAKQGSTEKAPAPRSQRAAAPAESLHQSAASQQLLSSFRRLDPLMASRCATRQPHPRRRSAHPRGRGEWTGRQLPAASPQLPPPVAPSRHQTVPSEAPPHVRGGAAQQRFSSERERTRPPLIREERSGWGGSFQQLLRSYRRL